MSSLLNAVTPSIPQSPFTSVSVNKQPAQHASAAAGPENVTLGAALVYIISGILQPLIMAFLKAAGVADASCQVYMLFYYLGPAVLLCTLFVGDRAEPWPSRSLMSKTAGIAMFDISAQALNYTGASFAGPTIFIIVYSSVAIWTALFSRLLLGRRMNRLQWLGVFTVFGGLAIAGTDSVALGQHVLHGTIMVLIGSCLHALTYVMSEALMTLDSSERLSARQSSALQSSVALVLLGIWQVTYTLPHFQDLVARPMQKAGTSGKDALMLLGAFALTNLAHSYSFFYTLKHFPGGSTSAGVMKGLMAVLVFCLTAMLFCGHMGGDEMCFSPAKLLSLMTVVGGVSMFAVATARQEQTKGYTPIPDEVTVASTVDASASIVSLSTLVDSMTSRKTELQQQQSIDEDVILV